MSKNKSKQNKIQESKEINPVVVPPLESNLELEPSPTDKDVNLNKSLQPTETQNQEAERAERQELPEVSSVESSEENIQPQTEPAIATNDSPIEQQEIDIVQMPQSQSFNLEIILSKILLLEERIKNLQENQQELKAFVEHQFQLQQEQINALRNEGAVSKQRKTNTELPKNPIDKTKKQSQPIETSPRASESQRAKRKKETFNTVAYLHEHDEAKLQAELDTKTTDELVEIMRSEKIKKLKEIKVVERGQMIKEIVLNAKRRLGQGNVFLKEDAINEINPK